MSLSCIKTPVLLLCAIVILLAACPATGSAEDIQPPETVIQEWEIQWFNEQMQPERLTSPSITEPWLEANTHAPANQIPKGYTGAWIHIAVPPTAGWPLPGLLIGRLYGADITVYNDGNLLYRSTREFSFERGTLLLELQPKSTASDLYIRINSMERAGLNSSVRIGGYEHLSHSRVAQAIPNLVLGCSIAFMALIMLLISGYLNVRQRKPWVLLGLFALSASFLILTNYTLPYVYSTAYGRLLLFLYDLSMLTVFPAFHMYAATIFEGKLTFYRTFGRWFTAYCLFGLLVLVAYNLAGDPLFVYYKLFTLTLLLPLLLIHLGLVFSHSVIQSVRGHKNSIILASGFLAFTVMFAADLYRFYTDESQPMPFLWQIGVVLLVISLVIVLARRISADHKQLVTYSQELEQFNRQLQRTEKLKFISEIAASIVHEVRNPLQVTRGFLQFISGKSDEASKSHFSIAIEELDRASVIITDFLTFAKPELDSSIAELDIQQEMAAIKTIMNPLAVMNGTVLQLHAADKLYVLGNTSKFKQAFMNMIKNSIEAIHTKEDGMVTISAYEENGMAVIRIRDNGEGMSKEQIARLGEPYYSTKAAGTGLGLMVTFRIIEMMKGTLEFRSEQGQGTEALVRYPLVHKPT
ncbi:sensor histidine kinase [Paenibacillus kobensis]|uniref:sensor histidine kinase n=1 Tax=Paenibacillus kobensis TaxID=59841 RepID=UPI000FD7B182|nr:sensor histidine kinase [Paenibacillus kobensis]